MVFAVSLYIVSTYVLCHSDVVGPRHPLRKDPNLDYDNDSDEEWEEVNPVTRFSFDSIVVAFHLICR